MCTGMIRKRLLIQSENTNGFSEFIAKPELWQLEVGPSRSVFRM